MPTSKNHKGHPPSPQLYAPCYSMLEAGKPHFWSETDSYGIQSGGPSQHSLPPALFYKLSQKTLNDLLISQLQRSDIETYLISSSNLLFSMVSLINKLPSSVLKILTSSPQIITFHHPLDYSTQIDLKSKINGHLNKVQKQLFPFLPTPKLSSPLLLSFFLFKSNSAH